MITGAYWGWFGVLSCVVVTVITNWMFLFFQWAIPMLAVLTVIGLSSRFKLIIHRSVIVLNGSFLGYTFVHDLILTDAANIELGFDPSVEIGSHEIGDQINASPLFHTIQAAIAHVRGDSKTTRAHLGMVSPITAAPKQDPVDVSTAIEVVDRYRHLGREVLMVRGWKSGDAERVSLYVDSESLVLVFDAYIRTLQIPELEVLRPTPANNDEMAMTTHRRFVWKASPFRLWHNGKLVASLNRDVLWTKKAGEIPRKDIESVRGWLSKDWLKLGVDLEIKHGRNIQVARGFNPDAGMNMFYDGLDLLFDVEWVESISRTIAQELNVRCIDDNLSGK